MQERKIQWSSNFLTKRKKYVHKMSFYRNHQIAIHAALEQILKAVTLQNHVKVPKIQWPKKIRRFQSFHCNWRKDWISFKHKLMERDRESTIDGDIRVTVLIVNFNGGSFLLLCHCWEISLQRSNLKVLTRPCRSNVSVFSIWFNF